KDRHKSIAAELVVKPRVHHQALRPCHRLGLRPKVVVSTANKEFHFVSPSGTNTQLTEKSLFRNGRIRQNRQTFEKVCTPPGFRSKVIGLPLTAHLDDRL